MQLTLRKKKILTNSSLADNDVYIHPIITFFNKEIEIDLLKNRLPISFSQIKKQIIEGF